MPIDFAIYDLKVCTDIGSDDTENIAVTDIRENGTTEIGEYAWISSITVIFRRALVLNTS